ncbi:MAG: hypothetical protein OXD37_06865 [Acidimicrobiaceae bacterium]|nr:hypothetical protein [Acidimicrobiaceae bacterium]
MTYHRLTHCIIRILYLQVLALFAVLSVTACTSSEEPGETEESIYYGVASDFYGEVQGYSEEEIGVEYLIDEYISRRFSPILTRHRSYEEAREAEEAAINNLDKSSVEARDRDLFEQTIRFVFFAASEAMPPETLAAVDELYDAFYDSLDLCVERSEWPGIQLYYYDDEGYYSAGVDQFFRAVELYGLTLDEFQDFEHECNKFAATYPSLNSQRRDELVNIRRDYFLEVLRLWMLDNPETVVPMTYEQSINHPYQDYIREICRAAENPEECARSEGITLE